LLGRLTRTHSPSSDIATAASPSGPAPLSASLDLVHTLPGRLFLLSSALLLIVLAVQYVIELPPLAVVFRRVVSAAFILSGIWLGVLVLVRQLPRVLWRVRRKLILSYVFVGVVPVLLVAVFVFVGGWVFYTDIAAYMFLEGLTNLQDDVQQIVETSAGELGRTPGLAQSALDRKYANLQAQYPSLSLVVVAAPVDARVAPAGQDAHGAAPPKPPGVPRAAPQAIAGAWRHQPPLASVPAWVVTSGGFAGVLQTSGAALDERLVIRVAVLTPDRRAVVIGDLPLDTDIITRLHERTGTRIDDIAAQGLVENTAPPGQGQIGVMFRETVAFKNCTDWLTGRSETASIRLYAPLSKLVDRLATAQTSQLGGVARSALVGILFSLSLMGGLLLIVLGSAWFMGALLAQSITSAVHELFMGTERIRQGDFAHPISIESRDQLGELGDSFNRMSGSIVHLLHVQREKQRLDDELRIARDIQKSLLPVEPPRLPGIDIADLCEPAREVGGDYYDFFALGPRQLGVLIADVSGKGTSAALYMAELKGLMLALSHTERSPRQLLIRVNKLLAAHLDNRSFITMTYAIVDLEAGTMTCARAGHTPLIVVSGGESHVIVPEGMVLGLRLPGAEQRFERLLTEHTRRVAPGDVIVLYTDGITEAMDRAGELFGDAALARVLSSHQRLDAAGIRERVLREVRAFVGDAEPHDDMTMVVLKITGDGGA
jgi:sigma-B regulation protein RsbU (phosphoserine phosphatase)